MHKGSGYALPYRKFLKQFAVTQAFAIGLSPFLPLTAVAQPVVPTPTPTPTTTPGVGTTTTTPSVTIPSDNRSNIILPTDVLPLTAAQEKIPFGENLQLRLNQILPARFYFSSSCETSLRFETNPFQFPTKRALLRQLPPPQTILRLSATQQELIRKIVRQANSQDLVFRVLPNITAGWTVTPRTRAFFNYFMIRDQLAKNVVLNTMIHSYAFGLQQDFPLGSRANLQAEIQFRELNQWHQQSVFDFLPGLTVSYIANPKTVLFANALLQMRGKKYFQAPTKELDPFYTFGALHSRGGWTFAASTTIVQNFREPFRGNATIPVNNYAIISDFEVARRLFKQIPGLQAFVRAEPIFNFHSHNRPGLAGTDFRLFGGLRMAVAKPALTATINNIMEQLRNQENETPGPQTGPKPSAYLPATVMADVHTPIHGSFGAGDAEGEGSPEAVMPPKVADAAADAGAAAEPVVAKAEVPAGPPDIATVDWNSVLSEVPPELVPIDPTPGAELAALLGKAAAETTVAAYDDTQKRANAIAMRAPSAPVLKVQPKPVQQQIEVAKADWDALMPAVVAATRDTGMPAPVEVNTETLAAASTKADARETATRIAKLVELVQDVGVIAARSDQRSAPTVAAVVKKLGPVVIPQAPVALAKRAVIATKPSASVPVDVVIAKKPLAPVVIPGAPVAVAKRAMIATKPSASVPIDLVIVRKPLAPVVIPGAPVAVAKRAMIATKPSASVPVDVVVAKKPLGPVVIPGAPVAVAKRAMIATKPSASVPVDVVVAKKPLGPVVIPGAPLAVAKRAMIATKPSASVPVDVVVAKKPLRPVVIPGAPVAVAKRAMIATKPSASVPVDAVVAKQPLAPVVIPGAPVAVAKRAVIATKPSASVPVDAVVARGALQSSAPTLAAKQPLRPVMIPGAPVAVAKPSMIASRPSAAVPVDVIAAKPKVTPHAPIIIPEAPVALSRRAAIALRLPVVKPDTEQDVTIDIKRAGNWEPLAAMTLKRLNAGGDSQSLGDLRRLIEVAAYESARNIDYAVLNNANRRQIAAKPPATKQTQPTSPARPVMIMPINVDMTPSSITSERGTAPENNSFAIERAPKQNPSKSEHWDNHRPTRAHNAKMDMHVVPPLPTVRVNDKENPFKGTGIDIHKSIMLSVPH